MCRFVSDNVFRAFFTSFIKLFANLEVNATCLGAAHNAIVDKLYQPTLLGT